MSNNIVVSADNHVIEPEDLWTGRGESKFKGRQPQLQRLEEGDWWFCDGRKVLGVTNGTQVGVRFDDPEKLTRQARIEQVRPGGYIPQEHVKDMDLDGVDVSIVYPTVGLLLYSVPDSDLLTSNCRAYNDWAGEFCSTVPKRLKGVAMVNVDDVGEGVRELERCAKLGFAGAMITVYPPQGRSYDRPEYEPLWAAAQDLGMPLGLHQGTNRPGAGQEFADLDSTRPSFLCNVEHWIRMSLADIILSGVFQRYPKLQLGSVEHELSWAPNFLERMDYIYGFSAQAAATGGRFEDGAVPSDFFHSNVFLGFQEDARGIRDRDFIGVDNLQWGSDYPHTGSTFPKSREIIDRILADCTEEEKAKIAGGNSARVYNLA